MGAGRDGPFLISRIGAVSKHNLGRKSACLVQNGFDRASYAAAVDRFGVLPQLKQHASKTGVQELHTTDGVHSKALTHNGLGSKKEKVDSGMPFAIPKAGRFVRIVTRECKGKGVTAC